jgi:hypothetical protein
VLEQVITSPLSLARVLWWYGEDALWPAALELAPQDVASMATRFAELRRTPELIETLWPGAPMADAHLVLGAIEHLEGQPRAAARRHRRGGPMPETLDLSEELRWADPALDEVLRLVDLATGVAYPRRAADLRPRLHGRWAPAGSVT